MLEIINRDFSPANYLAEFEKSCGDAGAIASFLGRVRKQDKVKYLELQSYKGVTEKGIKQAIKTASAKWSLLGVHVIHRIGQINTGQPIVLVMCASKHRRDAFNACDFLMDYLKTQAIFWKKQVCSDSEEWIEPREQDYQDNNRWK